MIPRRARPAVLLLIAAAAGGAAWWLWPAEAPAPAPAVARPTAALPAQPIVHLPTPVTPWKPPSRPALPPVKKGGNSWRPEAAPVVNKVETQRGAPDIPDAQPLARPPDP